MHRWNAFIRGVDIRLPTPEIHECGVFCGLHSLQGACSGGRRCDLELLRQLSPWQRPPAASPKRASIEPPRRWKLFFAGRSTLGGGRGEFFKHHQQRFGFAIRDTTGRYLSSPALEQLINESTAWFAEAMANSDFCLSPLGQTEGDSDRYLPAILYGCIPVFVCESEALPFF